MTGQVGKEGKRYLPCPKEKEAEPHQTVLYGGDRVPPGGPVVIVEGIMDAWKLGPGAVGIHGQKCTPSQLLKLIRSGIRKAGVFLDPDAGESSEALCSVLSGAGLEVYEIRADTDPGDLPEEEARKIISTF